MVKSVKTIYKLYNTEELWGGSKLRCLRVYCVDVWMYRPKPVGDGTRSRRRGEGLVGTVEGARGAGRVIKKHSEAGMWMTRWWREPVLHYAKISAFFSNRQSVQRVKHPRTSSSINKPLVSFSCVKIGCFGTKAQTRLSHHTWTHQGHHYRSSKVTSVLAWFSFVKI